MLGGGNGNRFVAFARVVRLLLATARFLDFAIFDFLLRPTATSLRLIVVGFIRLARVERIVHRYGDGARRIR